MATTPHFWETGPPSTSFAKFLNFVDTIRSPSQVRTPPFQFIRKLESSNGVLKLSYRFQGSGKRLILCLTRNRLTMSPFVTFLHLGTFFLLTSGRAFQLWGTTKASKLKHLNKHHREKETQLEQKAVLGRSGPAKTNIPHRHSVFFPGVLARD